MYLTNFGDERVRMSSDTNVKSLVQAFIRWRQVNARNLALSAGNAGFSNFNRARLTRRVSRRLNDLQRTAVRPSTRRIFH